MSMMPMNNLVKNFVPIDGLLVFWIIREVFMALLYSANEYEASLCWLYCVTKGGAIYMLSNWTEARWEKNRSAFSSINFKVQGNKRKKGTRHSVPSKVQDSHRAVEKAVLNSCSMEVLQKSFPELNVGCGVAESGGHHWNVLNGHVQL